MHADSSRNSQEPIPRLFRFTFLEADQVLPHSQLGIAQGVSRAFSRTSGRGQLAIGSAHLCDYAIEACIDP